MYLSQNWRVSKVKGHLKIMAIEEGAGIIKGVGTECFYILLKQALSKRIEETS